ncbi:MAG: cbb3-type cytochrome c oxidase subunit 3 [Calditerrivibrio sp.]|nr:cbb3-type cytochrome c oxidase subunit 3 [Calditerrivibrio sp.]
MAWDHIMLIIFGFFLVFLMLGAIIYYYLPHRKEKVEKAKYDMLKDEDE